MLAYDTYGWPEGPAIIARDSYLGRRPSLFKIRSLSMLVTKILPSASDSSRNYLSNGGSPTSVSLKALVKYGFIPMLSVPKVIDIPINYCYLR